MELLDGAQSCIVVYPTASDCIHLFSSYLFLIKVIRLFSSYLFFHTVTNTFPFSAKILKILNRVLFIARKNDVAVKILKKAAVNLLVARHFCAGRLAGWLGGKPVFQTVSWMK